jgi:hypothetical protein
MRRFTRTLLGLSGIVAAGALPAGAQPTGHPYHPPMPDQELFFQCRVEDDQGGFERRVVLKLPSASGDAELDQRLTLPQPLPAIRLVRYLSRASLEQEIVPVRNGPPAMEISIEGPTQSFRRWILADDPQRNRLISFIATWRYMAVADREQHDELFKQFETEFSREARLMVSRPDGSGACMVSATPGEVHELKALGCTLHVCEFCPHFAMDKTTGKVVNQSAHRRNPAVRILIEQAGRQEERWVFARFDNFKMHRTEELPIRVRLDCPIERSQDTPDFVLVTTGRQSHEVWTRYGGTVSARALTDEDRIGIGGSQYSFRLTRFVPAGQLVEVYRPSRRLDAVPALGFEVEESSEQPSVMWLALDESRVIPTEKGSMQVRFGRRPAGVDGD